MAFNYAKSRATAERLLTKFGQVGTIRRDHGIDNNDTPWDPSDDTPDIRDHACTLVVLDYAKREIDGSLVLATDRKCLISTDGLTIPALADKPDSENAPDVADKLVIGSNVFELMTVMPLSPGGTVTMWEVQARA